MTEEEIEFGRKLGGVNPSDFYTACGNLLPELRRMTEMNAEDADGNVVFVIYGKLKPNRSNAAVSDALDQFFAVNFEAVLFSSLGDFDLDEENDE